VRLILIAMICVFVTAANAQPPSTPPEPLASTPAGSAMTVDSSGRPIAADSVKEVAEPLATNDNRDFISALGLVSAALRGGTAAKVGEQD
jgi:hypothetical protein